MIRELIKPVDNTYTLTLPDEMIGKVVEVIAFEVNEVASTMKIAETSLPDIEAIKRRYARYPLTSHDGYKFNRDEANDYE